ncbi:MAG: pre-peptidase C-terminal domain-containing protein, partial [Algicola sp.]|nr:pre-peptidase C-terminal domain-containing protein [Algicola sp.]
MIIKKFTRAVLPSVIALTLVGCGVDGVPTPVVTGPVVEPTPAPVAVGQQVTLETAIEHITIDGVTQYYIDLEQDAETLVISFAKGVAGESLGDPDMYVKFEDDSATLDNYICASLRSPGSNETCIINKPQAGRYQIVIDPYLPSGETDNTVADATLWASTTLLPANRACNDGLVIRGQAMSENDLDNACNTINQTQTKFHQVF